MKRIIFPIMIMMLSGATFFDVVAQEEHHQHERHHHPKYAKLKNPIAKTEKSVAEGAKLYEKHCIACHGEAGKGGRGPHLTGPVRIHGNTDGEMFHVITDGVAGTAMKGFKAKLTDEMRWKLVNYIESLVNAKETE